MAAIEACVTSATFEKITAAQLQLPREQRQNIDAVLDVIATLAKDNVWLYRKVFNAYKQQTDQTFKQFYIEWETWETCVYVNMGNLRLYKNLVKSFVKTIKFVQLTNVY